MRKLIRGLLQIAAALFTIVNLPAAGLAGTGSGRDIGNGNPAPSTPLPGKDAGFFPVSRNADKTDTTPAITVFDYFISNKGSNRNNGKSAAAPRLYIDSVETLLGDLAAANKRASLGLDASSIFREQLDVSSNNISVGSYQLSDNGRFAKLTGMDVIREWKPSAGNPNVFEHLLQHSIKLDQPDYNYILVAEVDTVLEKTSPVGAVNYLRLAPDLASCARTPGTYYIAPLRTNPALVSIHPSAGVPGQTRFRYEATTRHLAINGYNTDGGRYQNLFLQSSGYGYGMLAGGKNTLVRNVVFQGGGTHHMVIKSGTIDSCLFFPGPAGMKDRIAAVFYENTGTGNINTVTNSIFLDVPFPLITHTSGTTNHQKLTLDKVYAFGNKSDAQRAFSALHSDTVRISDSYTVDYPVGWYGGDSKLSITNTIFRNTNQAAIFIFKSPSKNADAVISNVLIKTDANDSNQRPENKSAYGIRATYPKSNVAASNFIFHAYSTWSLINTPVVKTFSVGGVARAHHNIYICDVNEKNYVHMHKAFNNSGRGMSDNVVSDSNVFIIVRGRGFHWNVEPVNNGNSTIVDIERWRTLTGQDKHSIVIDLRKNPLGLKAIFVDPVNGNWSFTENRLVEGIRKLKAGMITPPLYYPTRPSIQYSSPFDTLGGFSGFNGTIDTAGRSVLEWRTFNETQYKGFAIEFSTDSINYTAIDTVQAKGGGGNNSYAYTEEQTAPRRYYRLRVISKDNTTFLSAAILLETGQVSEDIRLVVFPNPVISQLTVLHPKAENGALGLYGTGGQLLKLIRLQPGVSQSTLSLAEFAKGIYLVRWSSGRRQLAVKIMKVN